MRPGADDEEKRTNEIGTVIPLLDMLPDISGRTVTADAMLTQRKLATYLLDRGADYVFTVKGNQKTLLSDISLTLCEIMASRAPDFVEPECKPDHGRKEKRSIWVSSELNDYADFPGTGQIFAVHRENPRHQDRENVLIGMFFLSESISDISRLFNWLGDADKIRSMTRHSDGLDHAAGNGTAFAGRFCLRHSIKRVSELLLDELWEPEGILLSA